MYTTRDDDDVYECVTSENFPASFGEATITMHFMLRRSTRVWRTSKPPRVCITSRSLRQKLRKRVWVNDAKRCCVGDSQTENTFCAFSATVRMREYISLRSILTTRPKMQGTNIKIKVVESRGVVLVRMLLF